MVAPSPRELGFGPVIVGAGLTVSEHTQFAVPESGFVIVIVRAVAAAVPAIVMLALACVASVTVVELTVIPAPENDAVAPLTKPDPMIATG